MGVAAHRLGVLINHLPGGSLLLKLKNMSRMYPELQIVNALVKFQNGVTDKETRWVDDSAFKIAACYLASKLTPYHAREISGFFDINRNYMESQIQTYAVHLLMDPEAKSFMEQAETCYREMEFITKQNQL